MNALQIAWAYFRAQWFTAMLNVLLLAIGIAMIVVLLLVGAQFNDSLQRNGKGIDLVVGAKGSPLQLVLSSVYHLDVPTGNVPYLTLNQLRNNPMVASVIPLSLGDSFRGQRLVGTERAYAEHYSATLAEGRWYSGELEVVLGAAAAKKLDMHIDDAFFGAHGLAEGGHDHDQHPYEIVGILEPTGSVIDQLILTSLDSVWELHEEHAEPLPDEQREVTALLVQYRSPAAALQLPRMINSGTDLMAAQPAFETQRLLKLLGIGFTAMTAFAWVMIASAALGVFIALSNALQARRFDIAVMRTLGASKAQVMGYLLTESVLMVVFGGLAGLLLGHISAELLGRWLAQANEMAISGFYWHAQEPLLLLMCVLLGLVAAAVPAWRAYRRDVAAVLAEG